MTRRISAFEAAEAGLRDFPSLTEIQIEHLRARLLHDAERAYLYGETVARRVTRAQREARRATRGEQ